MAGPGCTDGAETKGASSALLVQLTGAREAVEVGTFTGYSALCIARALPDDGRLLACDISEEWTSIGRRYWAEAGVDAKIDLRYRTGPGDPSGAAVTTRRFDLALHRRRQAGLPRDYYEELVPRLHEGRPHHGRQHDLVGLRGRGPQGTRAPTTVAILAPSTTRSLDDERVTCVLLPIADGLTLLRKRAA